MAQVSRLPLMKDVQKRIYEVFSDSISMVTTQEQVGKLIDDLFSPTEKIMLAKRLTIALLLMKKYDQRSISKILKVSLGTVNKVSRSLQSGSGGYAMVINAIIRTEKFHELLDKLDDALANLMPPAHRNWSNWRRQRWGEKLRNQKPF